MQRCSVLALTWSSRSATAHVRDTAPYAVPRVHLEILNMLCVSSMLPHARTYDTEQQRELVGESTEDQQLIGLVEKLLDALSRTEPRISGETPRWSFCAQQTARTQGR